MISNLLGVLIFQAPKTMKSLVLVCYVSVAIVFVSNAIILTETAPAGCLVRTVFCWDYVRNVFFIPVSIFYKEKNHILTPN